MVLWALSELRYDALACLEALAEVGLKVLRDPAERQKLMAQGSEHASAGAHTLLSLPAWHLMYLGKTSISESLVKFWLSQVVALVEKQQVVALELVPASQLFSRFLVYSGVPCMCLT